METAAKKKRGSLSWSRKSYCVAYCVVILSSINSFHWALPIVEKTLDNYDNDDDDDDDRLCQENVYSNSLSLPLSKYGEHMDNWMSNRTQKEKELTVQTLGFEGGHKRFDAFEVMGACNTTCIGGACRKDTSKIVCLGDNDSVYEKNSSLSAAKNYGEPCVVYSIGGNNQWEFELDVLSKTPCEVHTFDCTGPITRFHKPESDRLHFHHVCLGTQHKPGPDKWGEFWTLEKIQETLRHPRIDLFKMDIEGYEWPLFESWPLLSEKRAPTTVLPMQILVEVHYKTQMTELAVNAKKDFKFSNDMIHLQDRFLKMGYAVVVRDDNRFCPHCTELTLVRIRCPPPLTTLKRPSNTTRRSDVSKHQ